MTAVVIPHLDLADTPLRIGVWHVPHGRVVFQGERLLEILAGDVVVELAAPADGVLHQFAHEEDAVTVGQAVGQIMSSVQE